MKVLLKKYGHSLRIQIKIIQNKSMTKYVKQDD